MSAEIKVCPGCKNTLAGTFQDRLYGKDHRVHNLVSVKKGDQKQYRCTVCGAVR